MNCYRCGKVYEGCIDNDNGQEVHCPTSLPWCMKVHALDHNTVVRSCTSPSHVASLGFDNIDKPGCYEGTLPGLQGRLRAVICDTDNCNEGPVGTSCTAGNPGGNPGGSSSSKSPTVCLNYTSKIVICALALLTASNMFYF